MRSKKGRLRRAPVGSEGVDGGARQRPGLLALDSMADRGEAVALESGSGAGDVDDVAFKGQGNTDGRAVGAERPSWVRTLGVRGAIGVEWSSDRVHRLDYPGGRRLNRPQHPGFGGAELLLGEDSFGTEGAEALELAGDVGRGGVVACCRREPGPSLRGARSRRSSARGGARSRRAMSSSVTRSFGPRRKEPFSVISERSEPTAPRFLQPFVALAERPGFPLPMDGREDAPEAGGATIDQPIGRQRVGRLAVPVVRYLSQASSS